MGIKGTYKINIVFFGGFETRRELQNNNLSYFNIRVSKQRANLSQDRVTAELIFVHIQFYCGDYNSSSIKRNNIREYNYLNCFFAFTCLRTGQVNGCFKITMNFRYVCVL